MCSMQGGPMHQRPRQEPFEDNMSPHRTWDAGCSHRARMTTMRSPARTTPKLVSLVPIARVLYVSFPTFSSDTNRYHIVVPAQDRERITSGLPRLE